MICPSERLSRGVASSFPRTCQVGDVEEDVKGALGGRDGVAAVPRLRLGLVGEEGGADKWSVDDLPEGVRCLGGEAAGDPVCNRGGSGEYTVAGLQLLVGVPQPVPYPDAGLGLGDLEHFGAEDDAGAEAGGDRLGQGGGPADDVAGEPRRAIPDQPEIPDARPGGHLLWGP